MKDVGEPGAGEPHARIDGRGLETERHSVTAPVPDPTILGIYADVPQDYLNRAADSFDDVVDSLSVEPEDDSEDEDGPSEEGP